MPEKDKENPSYYQRHREERLEYQKIYYAKKRLDLIRQRELIRHLEPESGERQREYQRAYYLRNRGRHVRHPRKK